MDRAHLPSMEEMSTYIEGDAEEMWHEMIAYIEDNFKVKPNIVYSACSGKPGWNVKYKKSGKALCTLYPEKGFFIVLVVLGQDNRIIFDMDRSNYSKYVLEIYDKSAIFNGTKWLMINVTDRKILEDVKRLIQTKVQKNISNEKICR